MKKLLFLLLTAITMTSFTGCSKDDNGGNGSLNGTSWESRSSATPVQGYLAITTLSFTAKNCKMSVKMWNNGVLSTDESYSGTYTFDGEKGSITMNGGTVGFTVSEKVLTVKDDEGDNVIFTKN